jgi:hypothetical protein
MLLNAYGWWQMGQIALISSIATFALAAIAAVLSVLGLLHFRRVPLDEEIPKLNSAGPVVPGAKGTGKAHAITSS